MKPAASWSGPLSIETRIDAAAYKHLINPTGGPVARPNFSYQKRQKELAKKKKKEEKKAKKAARAAAGISGAPIAALDAQDSPAPEKTD